MNTSFAIGQIWSIRGEYDGDQIEYLYLITRLDESKNAWMAIHINNPWQVDDSEIIFSLRNCIVSVEGIVNLVYDTPTTMLKHEQ